MTILVGVKKFYSNKKQKDFYQLQLVIPGPSGEGNWVASPFCSKKCYESFKVEDSGKEIEMVRGYDEDNGLQETITKYYIRESGGTKK